MSVQDQLETLLSQWQDEFDESGAFTGSFRSVESRIIALARNADIPKGDGILFRGTGLLDEDFDALLAGQKLQFPPTQRLFSSWTWSEGVARSFMECAVESNRSSVLLAVPSSELEIVLDTSSLPYPFNAEQEVLVRNVPFAFKSEYVREAWRYSETDDYCHPVAGVAAGSSVPTMG